MPKLEKDLNPWIFSYIRHHHNAHSRYEIDRYLIETGANPAEIEEVWAHLVAPPAGKPSRQAVIKSRLLSVWSTLSSTPQATSNPSKTALPTLGRITQKILSLPKKLLSITELWWLGFSIILFVLALATIDVLSFYGFIFVEKAMVWPLALTCLISLIVFARKLSKRTTNSFKRNLLGWLALLLFGLSIPLYGLMGLFGTFTGGYSYTDIATTQANGHTYHLARHESFWDSPSYLELYKCEVFGVICPRTENKHVYIDTTNGPYHLNYNPANQKLELWSKGNLIATFDQKVG